MSSLRIEPPRPIRVSSFSEQTVRPAPAESLQPSRLSAGYAVVMATGIGIVLALTIDIITGRWVGAPWLHLLLAGLIVAAWLPWASRVRYIEWAPLYVLGLLIYTVLRSFADQTAIAPRYDLVIAIEE